MSTTGIKRFNKFNKKSCKKLMLDNNEKQLVGKMSYNLFCGNKHKLVEVMMMIQIYFIQLV